MWKLCMDTAVAKHAIGYSHTSISGQNIVKATMATCAEFKNFLDFLSPIAARTNFEQLKLNLMDSQQFGICMEYLNVFLTGSTDEQATEELINEVAEHQKDEKDKLSRTWDGMKDNLSEQFEVAAFVVAMKTASNGKYLVKTAAIFKTPRSMVLWSSYTRAVFRRLGISQSSFVTCAYHPGICLSVTSKHLERALELMYSIARRTAYDHVLLSNARLETVNLISDFFEKIGSSVPNVSFCSKTEEHDCESLFEPYLRFAAVVRCATVEYRPFKHVEGEDGFLLKLADIVDAIDIKHVRARANLSVSFIKEILGRKCKELQIAEGTALVSLPEAEELTQILHHTGKKLFLCVPTNSEIFHTQIGEFCMNTVESGENRILSIRHLVMNPN